jgi:hypothetical protein
VQVQAVQQLAQEQAVVQVLVVARAQERPLVLLAQEQAHRRYRRQQQSQCQRELCRLLVHEFR